jgi:integrase
MAHIQKKGTTHHGKPITRWQARYRAPDGKERSRLFDRRIDAERWLIGQEGRKLKGEWVDPEAGRTPLREWADEWWTTVNHLRPSSRARSEGILRKHLLPRFGEWPLAGILPTDVRAFVSDLYAEGLAPASVRKAYNVFRAIMRAAEESNVIGRSPCIGIKLPKAVSNEPRFLSPEELGALADAVPDRYRALVLVGGYGGLRFGELVGLTVPRVDFLRSRLMVVDSIVEVAGLLHRGPTKTGPSRVVTLPRFVTEALAHHVRKYPPGDGGLVFTAPQGGPIRRSIWRARVWVEATVKAKVHPLRVHDLRHTAAALAIKAGAHPKAIADRLGHASITTTLNTYGHLFPALDEELAERLDTMGRDSASVPAESVRNLAEAAVVPMVSRDVENSS